MNLNRSIIMLAKKNLYVRTTALLLTITTLSLVAFGQIPDRGYEVVSPFQKYVLSRCKNVADSCKITDRLEQQSLSTLPIGISPQGCSGTTIIVIDSAQRVDRRSWFFSAYASVIIPGTNDPLAFAAKNIGFGKGGLKATSQIKLVLVTPQRIRINDNLTLELPADGHNYVEFDCSGFKAINLKGNFVFSDGLLKPDKDLAKGATTVTASFEINTHDLNNIMATVNITPFTIRGLDDVSFEVRNAVVDYSDLINPSGFIFPQGYQQTFGDNINLWRGFYLQDLAVRIKGFSDSTTSGKDLKIEARNLLIDDLGVSGLFSVSNLLNLKEGSAGGWPLSIEELSVKIQLNRLTGGAMSGEVSLPFLGENPMGYSAMVEQDNEGMNYRFSVATSEDKKFGTPFGGEITLSKGSIIGLEKKGNGGIAASALLNGKLSLDGKMKVKEIRFENLGLITRKPYVVSGNFSTVGSGQSSSSGFPVQINTITFKILPGQVALGFTVMLNFMNSDDKGFAGSTHLDVIAKLEETSDAIQVGEQVVTRKSEHWKFDKVVVSEISLDCKTQAFTLKGKLSIFDDDPVYGDGFHGNLAFTIKKILENGVKVNAYFGSKDSYRYWHVDAYVPLGRIMIVGPLFLTGIMGGASYHMVRQQPMVPDFSKMSEEKASTLGTGNSEEALVYIPDGTAGLGFLAGVTLVVAIENAINADVMLEVMFNQGGGLKYVQFNGSAFFLTAINGRGRVKDGNVPKVPVMATMSMLFDNDNNVFHANMRTYINLFGILQGVGENGLVGEAVIHIDPHDWYTYIGRPTQMFGLNILGIATVETYFMVGTKIENLPLPPPEVREIFKDIDLRLMRDDLAAAGGKGFAFGLHFKIAFDSKDKLRPFYVMLAVGAGADIMLRNYGNTQCEGHDGRIGIGGWYASGQAYVFLIGKVGIRVKKKSFDIISLGVAALLQATLPNPTWMRGMLAGNYSVLGGLVKGKFNLDFTIGEQCEMVNPGAEIEDVVVIADIKPDNNGIDVNVFAAPQVSFNTAINTDFSMMDLNNNLNAHRIQLDEFTLTSNGVVVDSKLQWNAANDVAILKTHEILPPLSTLDARVKIHWEKKNDRGIWEVMKDINDQIIYETKETHFTTGEAPNFIPDENVAFSYPIKNQYNLHVNESGKGYVKLNVGQEYLFKAADETTQWNYVAQFKKAGGSISEIPIIYNAPDARVDFDFPQLEKKSIYTIRFIKRPQSVNAIDQNVQRSEVRLDGGKDNEVTVNSNALEGTLSQNVDKDIYTSAFRSSQFGTFGEKWESLGRGRDQFDVALGHVAVIGKRVDTEEAFDEFELTEKETSPALVQFVASPENEWFKNIISPLLYDLYPYDPDVSIHWRKPEVLGIKPLKGVDISNSIESFRLTDNDIAAGTAPGKRSSVLMAYYLSFYCYGDYQDLVDAASAKYLDNWSARPEGVKRLLAATGYTDLLEGNYPVNVSYTLPGAQTPSYQNQVSIKF